MPARRHRPLRRALPLAVAGLLLAGCGDPGKLVSAGPAEEAGGPVRLWPGLPPVTSPPYDYGEVDTARVPGIEVPAGGVRALDPVAVLRAEEGASPHEHSGIAGLYMETVQALPGCTKKPRTPRTCPVLAPYYRDLTGDGREELIVGVTMPEQQTAVRCYMPDGRGGLTRIMATSDQMVRIELAGRDLVLHSVSAGIPGYEYRTAWSWDETHGAMLQARDEIVRVKPLPESGRPSPARETAG
ncbi:hypothetical protein [Streptomyces yaizuensis]|uniref:Lipoprotein n=1 Tax=Streptomyces yaizuensis TaxID=2989713 RepID=A0ABQ5NXE2_9ACTN|nr:hypothetical protein [Streptomyces sp. YSPA8]GLF94641.1 lipoprotein [Streptomyces sp. YSPA8]